jgi:serine/threonine protein kinase/Tol biopolymer transport system component
MTTQGHPVIGQRIAHYRVQEKIGAGGMGEVYRAQDTRLGRDVALKVLPEVFARDAERMARFEREAKVLASLNHPNIATIYGVEESNGARALVMELVEGPTLAERIGQGPLPLEEALRFAQQIAEGLEYAHERGIIHRDLKPSNVKLTPESQVKLLDFGLAKALERETTEGESRDSPTLSAAATRTGVLLGTAGYMSPEQARGKRVDRRADIWAFGCVLYEMLTGLGAFSGETTSDILASVIRSEPDWSSLSDSVAPRIRELLHRCLQKDAKQRLRDIGDARIIIQEARTGSSASDALPDTSLTHAPRRPGMLLAWLAMGLVLGAVCAGFLALYLRPSPGQRVISRFAFSFPSPDGQPAASEGFPLRDFPAVAISRDGTKIAYLGARGHTTQLFLRRVDRLEPQPLPDSANATSPFFSPDGQWVGFFADGKLKKASVQGGEATALCDAPINRGATWGPDSTITFAPTLFGGLMRVSAAGGSPEILTAPDVSKGELTYRWPEILPGGKAILFVIANAQDIGSFSESKIAAVRLDTHEKKILPIVGTYPRYSPSGHLLFERDGRVFAVPFDLNRLEVTGQPVPVLDGVKTSPNSGAADFAVSDSGSLVYLPENAYTHDGQIVWVDRKKQVKELAAPARHYGSPHISPDGERVAIAIPSGNSGSDVWVYEIPHGRLTRLTFDEHSSAPIWSPDGKRIAFATTRPTGPAILVKPADGSGAEETLVAGESLILVPTSWSSDGKFLAYWAVGSATGRDIWIAPLTGERKPQPFLQTKFNEMQARFSPDSRWIAYQSEESGRYEVYVQPFPGPGGKWQISTNGGTMPVWAQNGRELFYMGSGNFMSVSVTAQPTFSASTPRIVADYPPFLMGRLSNGVYDVSPNGQQILFVKANVENGPPDEVRVVLNWTEELKHLAPTSKQP